MAIISPPKTPLETMRQAGELGIASGCSRRISISILLEKGVVEPRTPVAPAGRIVARRVARTKAISSRAYSSRDERAAAHSSATRSALSRARERSHQKAGWKNKNRNETLKSHVPH